MTDKSSEFAYLWDGSEPDWVLLRGSKSTRSSYAIFNLSTRGAMLIEDDELFHAVVEEMLSKGAQVFDRLPPS